MAFSRPGLPTFPERIPDMGWFPPKRIVCLTEIESSLVLQPGPAALAADLDGLTAMRPERGLTAVYLVDPDVSVETEPERLQRLFGLAAAEADIAKRDADGEVLRHIAEQADRQIAAMRRCPGT